MLRRIPRRSSSIPLTLVALVLALSSVSTALAQPGSQATGEPTIENPPYGSQYSGPGGGQERGTQDARAAGNPAAGNPMAGNQTGTAAMIVCPGGCYGGFHPFTCRAYAGAGYYGFFRRYYGYPFYGPTYRSIPMTPELGYGLVNGVVYHAGSYPLAPGGCGTVAPGSAPTASPASAPTPPRPANSAYLQLVVPENAEVLVDGDRTTQKGATREFISPPLAPEQNFLYTIAVRLRTAEGKVLVDQREIRVRANEQLRIDFTQPISTPMRPAQ